MSAWIVENKTINRILTYLVMNRSRLLWGKHEIITQDKLIDDIDELGKQMMTMNCEAVGHRYNTEPNKEAIEGYEYQSVVCSAIQAFKSLQCFTYQCSEGNVPERELYKELRQIEHNMASEIISALPEYEKAKWE